MVRCLSLSTLSGLALVATSLVPGVNCLWPRPASLTTGNQARAVSPDFVISIPKSLDHDNELQQACQRALGRIYDLALKPYVPDRGLSFEDEVRKSTPLSKLNVEINGPAGFDIKWDKKDVFESVIEFNKDEQIRLLKRKEGDQTISSLILEPLEKLDESYELTVLDGNGVATLKARNALGALRGLATFTQMVYDLPSSSTRFIPNLPHGHQGQGCFSLPRSDARHFSELPASIEHQEANRRHGDCQIEPTSLAHHRCSELATCLEDKRTRCARKDGRLCTQCRL